MPQDLPKTASWRLWAREKLKVTMPVIRQQAIEVERQRQKMIAEIGRRAAIEDRLFEQRAKAAEELAKDLLGVPG